MDYIKPAYDITLRFVTSHYQKALISTESEFRESKAGLKVIKNVLIPDDEI